MFYHAQIATQKFATIICLKLGLYLADMWSQMAFSGMKAVVLCKLQSPFYCLCVCCPGYAHAFY
jgi:hypothetical protein